MAFTQISLSQDSLLTALRSAVDGLLYLSESEAPLVVQSVSVAQAGEAFSETDLQRLFYDEEDTAQPTRIHWAEMHRADSNGTKAFFGRRLNFITTQPDNEVLYALPAERQEALRWRTLRDLLADNLIDLRYFKVELSEPETARKDIYVVGRHVEIQVDTETNEVDIDPLNWVVISTYVIET